jgi:hypothetical protein
MVANFAKFNKSSGLLSELAPASSKSVVLLLTMVGMVGMNPGRKIPSNSFNMRCDPAIKAALFPPVIMASTAFSLTRSSATTMEESFLRRTSKIPSCIVISSVVAWIDSWSWLYFFPFSSCWIFSASPTKTKWRSLWSFKNLSDADTAGATPWSAPITSKAILYILVFLSKIKITK